MIAAIEAKYADSAINIDKTDGLSLEYDNWRFNVRMSNTEPVLRLNVEAKGDGELMKAKTAELLALIKA